MRIEGSVTCLSWIPSEAIAGMTRVPFDRGVARYDDPPPETISDLEELGRAGRFRVANELRAWVEVSDGRIVDHGQEGRGHIAGTVLQLGRRPVTFHPLPLPDIRPAPEVGATSVTFTQTCGGRTGVPAPRRVRRPPFVQFTAPVAWTTLALTIHADGAVHHELVGASPFPRHWVYDGAGRLVAKSGTIDFRSWYRGAFGRWTPWGARDSRILTAAAESALERELSALIMHGSAPPVIRAVAPGDRVLVQAEPGDEMVLVLDGVVVVEVDGVPVAEYGPGSVHGERAALEAGARTSTVRAVTPGRVAVVPARSLGTEARTALSAGHRRELLV
ncbi:MAG TPA: cyclic nucleotide-binding domain-containing protein [Acidimicrobiales bacterium]|nr:cyclic nucleotide-binding domain-containing protein [Acidimicrobiales bacterium]